MNELKALFELYATIFDAPFAALLVGRVEIAENYSNIGKSKELFDRKLLASSPPL